MIEVLQMQFTKRKNSRGMQEGRKEIKGSVIVKDEASLSFLLLYYAQCF
jgi:hypothetical protein